MRLDLPFPEAVALATITAPLPEMVRSLSCTGSTVRADIDLRAIPTDSAARRLAFAAAGTVVVTARLDAFAAGIVSVTVTAHARGLPAHKLLPYLIDPINAAVAAAGLPEGVVSVVRGDGDPVVAIDVQKAVEAKTSGIAVTALSLTDAVLSVEVAIGEIRTR